MLKVRKFFKRLYKFKILIVTALFLFTMHCSLQLFLSIEKIQVVGANHVDKDALDLPRLGTNILNYSLDAIYGQVVVHEWVQSATIKRILPNKIKIEIEEHIPFATWNKQFLIDKGGNVITDHINRENLLSVIGDGANLVAYQFIKVVGLELDGIKELQYINKRRWNIIFYGGLTVKLPDEDAETVWLQALAMIDRNNLLASNISVLDMRVPDKFFIK